MEASPTRRSIFAMLAILTIATVFTVERMTQPEPAQACPVCVGIAGVGAYELITTGLIAGAATYSGIKLHQVIDGAAARPTGSSATRRAGTDT